jgi:hypothetical protein
MIDFAIINQQSSIIHQFILLTFFLVLFMSSSLIGDHDIPFQAVQEGKLDIRKAMRRLSKGVGLILLLVSVM